MGVEERQTPRRGSILDRICPMRTAIDRRLKTDPALICCIVLIVRQYLGRRTASALGLVSRTISVLI